MLGSFALTIPTAPPAAAASGTLGAPQVIINPGGGTSLNGDNGLKIILNSTDGSDGQDQVWFANTV
ncbi:MAG: hypothetical protein IT196_07180, partial [Acidimicrobiales bacterium]|nr:hypothetical protein [Acidimicrobiales bacterium]